MKGKPSEAQQTFDFGSEEETIPPPMPVEEDAWSEVPQRRFFSWCDAEQWLYCAVRDEDAAAHADTAEQAAWYRQRAKGYQEEYQRAAKS